VQRAAGPTGASLGVTPCGALEGGGIRLDDRVEDRVDPFDAVQVGLGQLDAAQCAGGHQRLEGGERGLEPRGGIVRVHPWRQRLVDALMVAAGNRTTRVD
jgi:hypothetical protein